MRRTEREAQIRKYAEKVIAQRGAVPTVRETRAAVGGDIHLVAQVLREYRRTARADEHAPTAQADSPPQSSDTDDGMPPFSLHTGGLEPARVGFLNCTGHWWLPDRPNGRIPGRLTVDWDGNVMVELEGWFSDRPLATIDAHKRVQPHSYSFRVDAVHGETSDGEAVTLAECVCQSHKRSNVNPQPYIQASAAYVGAHVENAPATTFSRIEVHYTRLNNWLMGGARPPARTDVSVGDGTVTLVYTHPTAAGDALPDPTRWYHIEMEHGTPLTLTDWRARYIDVFANLMTFATGYPNTAIRLRAHAVTPAGEAQPVDVYYAEPRDILPDGPVWPLLGYADVRTDLEAVVRKWVTITAGKPPDSLRAFVGLFCMAQHWHGMPEEFRFIALQTALEGYHRARFPNHNIAPCDHAAWSALAREATASLPDDARAWVSTRLDYNECGQSRRWRELLGKARCAAGDLVSDYRDLAKKVQRARGRVVHDGYTFPELPSVNADLVTVARACLLQELVPADDARLLMQRFAETGSDLYRRAV
jgi:hypothetical protein